MIWAVQKASMKQKIDPALVEKAIQGLYTNQINTSWYQRPQNALAIPMQNPFAVVAAGPKNQELIDCIQLYERYSAKLMEELDLWQTIQETLFSQFEAWSHQAQTDMQPDENKLPQIPSFKADLENLTQWIDLLPTMV